MNKIRPYSEVEKHNEVFRMLQSAHTHILYAVQCQNCSYYKPDKDVDNYIGHCDLNERGTYWSDYCDDFEVQE